MRRADFLACKKRIQAAFVCDAGNKAERGDLKLISVFSLDFNPGFAFRTGGVLQSIHARIKAAGAQQKQI